MPHLEGKSGHAMGMAYGICKVVWRNGQNITNLMRWRSQPFFCLCVKVKEGLLYLPVENRGE